jgi:(S)-2-hydroxyglutarate dehydrogenase
VDLAVDLEAPKRDATCALTSPENVDLVVIGAGIVGLATARTLLATHPGLDLVVLEAEDRPAAHQTGNNSGVIHSGLYYRPESLKAVLCAEGREALYRYCVERDIPHERCGKLVVATRPRELERLDELERRGRANGLSQLQRLGPAGLRDHEPRVRGLGGLWVGETGIVDYVAVARAMAWDVRAAGGEVRLSRPVRAITSDGAGFVFETAAGVLRARHLVNCAGAQADRMAKLAGHAPNCRIVPFRGEYKVLVPERRNLVRGLIYPVPDPRFPFLGVHFTRRVGGEIEAGPNAVLALSRNGYSWGDVSPRDLGDLASYGGFWRMAARYWRTGLGEVLRSFSTQAFAHALRRLVPDVRAGDLAPGGAGVRAQALDPDGTLADDFRIVAAPGAYHVLCAPSPAATASLAIGRHVARGAAAHLGLSRGKA